MINYRIDFAAIPWESPIAGLRRRSAGSQSTIAAGRVLEDLPAHWCEEGHIGYVWTGRSRSTSMVKRRPTIRATASSSPTARTTAHGQSAFRDGDRGLRRKRLKRRSIRQPVDDHIGDCGFQMAEGRSSDQSARPANRAQLATRQRDCGFHQRQVGQTRREPAA